MDIKTIIQFIAELVKQGFTGRISIDFHKGNISHKIKKEIVEVIK
jgi:hypothetical protein